MSILQHFTNYFPDASMLYDHAVQPEGQADKKNRRYSVWGLLQLDLFSLRRNIETSYYEPKTFCDYMTRTANGIERLENL